MTQGEVVLLIIVVVGFGVMGAFLWRIVRSQEKIVRTLGEMARNEAAPPKPALGPTLAPRSSSLDAMRKELEERRRTATDQDDE